MTIAVDLGRKATKQTKHLYAEIFCLISKPVKLFIYFCALLAYKF